MDVYVYWDSKTNELKFFAEFLTDGKQNAHLYYRGQYTLYPLTTGEIR